MKCHIRPIRFEILFEFESLLPIRFVFDSNANGRFAGPYSKRCHIISYHTISNEKLIARPLPSGPRHGDDESQAHSRFAAVHPTGRKY